MSDDESSCQDINECEIYDNDDDEDGEEEDEENSPKATFCSHTCSNLIGLFHLNIYFPTFHVFIVQQRRIFQEASFVPAPRTSTFMTTNVHAFVTIVLICRTNPNALTTVLMNQKVGFGWELFRMRFYQKKICLRLFMSMSARLHITKRL